MTKIEDQILRKQEEIRQLRKEKEQLNRIEAQRRQENPPKRTGRPKLKPELIERAKEMAKTKFLPDIALSLGISLSSLYNHGISRASIKKVVKNEVAENCEVQLKE